MPLRFLCYVVLLPKYSLWCTNQCLTLLPGVGPVSILNFRFGYLPRFWFDITENVSIKYSLPQLYHGTLTPEPSRPCAAFHSLDLFALPTATEEMKWMHKGSRCDWRGSYELFVTKTSTLGLSCMRFGGPAPHTPAVSHLPTHMGSTWCLFGDKDCSVPCSCHDNTIVWMWNVDSVSSSNSQTGSVSLALSVQHS